MSCFQFYLTNRTRKHKSKNLAPQPSAHFYYVFILFLAELEMCLHIEKSSTYEKFKFIISYTGVFSVLFNFQNTSKQIEKNSSVTLRAFANYIHIFLSRASNMSTYRQKLNLLNVESLIIYKGCSCHENFANYVQVSNFEFHERHRHWQPNLP